MLVLYRWVFELAIASAVAGAIELDFDDICPCCLVWWQKTKCFNSPSYPLHLKTALFYLALPSFIISQLSQGAIISFFLDKKQPL